MEQNLFNYYKNALSNGLCSEYKGRWMACHDDKEKLVKLVMAQQSLPHFIYYCYNGMGVSKDFILENFGEYVNGRIINDADGVSGYTYSLYVAYNGIISNDSDVFALMWSTNTTCEIKAAKSPVLYVGAGSNVNLSLDGYNCPHVYLFDDSKINITNGDESSEVIVYRYSERAKVEIDKYCLAKVKIFDKELKL